MMQHQVEDLRSAALRASLRIRPPSEVMILQEHADFLGVEYSKSRPRELSVVEAMARQQAKAAMPKGKPYGPLVRVKFERLYLALRNAKGVNHPEYRFSEDQAKDQDHGQASATAEGGGRD